MTQMAVRRQPARTWPASRDPQPGSMARPYKDHKEPKEIMNEMKIGKVHVDSSVMPIYNLRSTENVTDLRRMASWSHSGSVSLL
jgi:hypothetical protein